MNPPQESFRPSAGRGAGHGLPRVRVLGGLVLEGTRNPPPARLPLAVLARLVAEHPSTVSRQRLAAFLWPDHPPRRGRHRLSDSLYTLRGALGEEALVSSGDDVGLDPEQVTCDLWEFDAALREGRPRVAVELHGGPFLEGFLPGEGGEFEPWADLERSRVRRRFRTALEALAREGEEEGDPREAALWWRRLVEEDPVHEVAVLRLMQALDAAGERGEALRWAERHVRAMQEEFGAEPDPEVLALAGRLREGSGVRGSLEGVWVDRETPPEGPPRGARAATWNRELPLPDRETPPGSVGSAVGPEPTSAGGASGERGPRESRGLDPIPSEGGTTRRRSPGVAALALAGGAVAVLLGFLVAVPALRSPGPVPADPRVLVLPLENRSGDPGLSPLGDVAADRIILALSRAGVARVAPLDEGIRASVAAGAERVAGGSDASPPPLPGDPGSPGGAMPGFDLRVEGALNSVGDSLEFQVMVTDLRRRVVVAAVGPTRSPVEDPLPVLDDLARRTVAVLALQGDSTSWARALLAGQPPRIEAYREYVEGTRAFVRGDFRQAVERYAAAVALDSTFHAARLALAWSLGNVGRRAESRGLQAALREVEHELAPLHRSSLDLLQAAASGDPVRRYEAARRAAEAHGHWEHTRQWGLEALRAMNRPREALSVLEGMGHEGPHRETPQFWTYRARAHHVLAQHRHELGVAREARRANPEALWALELEAFALAALGRVDEVDDVVRERLVRSRPGPEHPLEFILYTALELQSHGQPEAATHIIGRGVEWYRSLPPPQQADHSHLGYHALLLMHAGEPTAAEALLRKVAKAHPREASLAGHIGVLAAERGDRDEARRIADRLGGLEGTATPGDHPLFWKACVVAALGETDEAVGLLREALRQGVSYHPRPHRLRCFDSLRSDGGFQELFSPRG